MKEQVEIRPQSVLGGVLPRLHTRPVNQEMERLPIVKYLIATGRGGHHKLKALSRPCFGELLSPVLDWAPDRCYQVDERKGEKLD